MKFSQLISEMITTASLGNWSQNPRNIGFDVPFHIGNQLKKRRKKSLLFGLNRREYAKAIGTTENYYNKEVNKIL